MLRCPDCHNSLFVRAVRDIHAFSCIPCESIGFTYSEIRRISGPEFKPVLESQPRHMPAANKGTLCFQCHGATTRIKLAQGPVHEENLRLLQKGKRIINPLKGALEIQRCESCGAVWMKGLALAHIPIEWEQVQLHAARAREAGQPTLDIETGIKATQVLAKIAAQASPAMGILGIPGIPPIIQFLLEYLIDD